MFITIYYGDQKSLLFNPSCSVVNLLNSIKERCGYGDSDRILDLTDETGIYNFRSILEQVKHLIRIHKRLRMTFQTSVRQTNRKDLKLANLLFKFKSGSSS